MKRKYLFSLRFRGSSSVPRGIQREVRDVIITKRMPLSGKRYKYEDEGLVIDVKVRDITDNPLRAGYNGFERRKLDEKYQWIIDSIIENGEIIKEEK